MLTVPVVPSSKAGVDAIVIVEQALYFAIPTGFVPGNPRLGVVLDSAF